MSSTDADAPAQLQQVKDGVGEVLLVKRALVERRGIRLVVQLDVELHAADAREIVLARVEEHALEQLSGGVESRRIARAQLAVDFEQRVVLALHRILAQGGGNDVAGFVAVREEDLEALRFRLRPACRVPWRSVRDWLRSALRRLTCR